MKISVVIPLYNKEKHIQMAINSVLNQTYQEFEIIVINDGSTDNSVAKVNEIKDSRIRLINQENKGVSAARNRGIKEANYELIAFLDADDTWKPQFLETIKRLRDRYPYAGMYGTAYEYQRPDGKKIAANYNDIPYTGWEGVVDNYFKASIKNQLICASAVAIPKKVFNDVGYFPIGMARGEDLNMWLRIALKYDVAFSNNICVTYNQNADNRVCNDKVAYSKSFISQVEDFFVNNLKNVKDPFYFREYMIRLFITKAIYLIEMGKRKEARMLLKKYKNTKYFKRQLSAVYILSFMPNMFNRFAFKVRAKLKLLF